MIPVREQNEFRFNVYTMKDGQLTLHEIDAKTGRETNQRPTNAIAELGMSRFVGHEEMGGQQQQQPMPPRGGDRRVNSPIRSGVWVS